MKALNVRCVNLNSLKRLRTSRIKQLQLLNQESIKSLILTARAISFTHVRAIMKTRSEPRSMIVLPRRERVAGRELNRLTTTTTGKTRVVARKWSSKFNLEFLPEHRMHRYLVTTRASSKRAAMHPTCIHRRIRTQTEIPLQSMWRLQSSQSTLV